jgi:predicted MPP superfamily phosphohydrolase
VHAVLGNHDWWEDQEARRRGRGPVRAGLALERAGIPVYHNASVRLEKDGAPFWLAGLGDQWGFSKGRACRSGERSRCKGMDDLDGTLRQVTDDAPVLLMAHEPDIFPKVPDRVALTIAGHTHGGQVKVLGYAPIVPSRYGSRYIYGHIVEEGRNLVVSAGLGCSIAPVRLGAPPEIVLIEVGARA